ncbi:MAG: 3-deoxy-7-phosphoheptulonate synthase [Patescibacteria group bacterium]
MSYVRVKQLPTSTEVLTRLQLTPALARQVEADRCEIQDILSGKDTRKLLIIGPCSAWPGEAVLEYARRLKEATLPLETKLKVVLRAYVDKPRTRKDWLGPASQPDPFLPPNLGRGTVYARNLLLQVLEAGLPVASEVLFSNHVEMLSDLLAWGAIGARSVEDQEHRLLASALDCPVGMKNPTGGHIEPAVNAAAVAQQSNDMAYQGYQVRTRGNAYAHLVLRGGRSGPNYSRENILEARDMMCEQGIRHPAVMIDAGHDNCICDGKKDPSRQADVIREVMGQMQRDPGVASVVKGFMVESFIKGGKQDLNSLTPATVDRSGLSVTDPCLSCEETQELLHEMQQRLKG